MEALKELRHEGLSFVTVEDIWGSERKVQAVDQGGSEFQRDGQGVG